MDLYRLGHMVVTRLTVGLKNLGHMVVMDNFFSLVQLFHNLVLRGFWASDTVKDNEKGLPKKLSRKLRVPLQGSLIIKMHDYRKMVEIS
jgi:hypothetical protein